MRLIRSKAIASAVAGLAIASGTAPVSAQDSAGDGVNSGLDNGSGNGLGYLAPQVTFRSGIEGEEINLTIGTAADGWYDLNETKFSITLTAPFDKDEDIGHFITEAGLPATWSAGFNLSHSFSSGFAEDSAIHVAALDALYSEAKRLCRVEFAGNVDNLKKCDGSVSAVADLIKGKHPDIDTKIQTTLRLIVEEDSDIPYFGLNFSAKVGHETLGYRDPTTFAEMDKRNTPFSIAGSFAWVPNISKPLGLFGGAHYRKSFKLPKKETRCPAPAITPPSVTCFNAAYGPPEKEIDTSVFGAMRLNGALSDWIPVSAEVKFAYDFHDDDWGVSIPVYFFRNKDGALNGGVKAEYDSGEKDWSFGVFIGTTFDFLKL